MNIDLDQLSSSESYFLLTQTIVPRPVAWVLSDNGDGSHNLAPFSYFNAVCSSPPLVVLSIGWKDAATKKDTRLNIEERKDFVIHIAHPEMLEALNESSRTLPHGESELKRVGMETVPFENFRIPRLKDARVAMACERYAVHELGDAKQGLIFGLVRRVYLDDEIAAGDGGRLKVDAEKLDPIGRLGGGEFCTFGDLVKCNRPT